MKANRTIANIFIVTVVLLACLSVSANARRATPLGGLLDLYPWPEDSVNLVKNPSFEEVDAAGKALGWRVRPADRWFPNSSAAQSGVRSLNLKDSHLSRRYPLASQKLTLEPGWYTMRGWLKAEKAGTNTKGAGGRLSLWLRKGKQKRWNSTAIVRGTTDWTKVERRIFPVKPGESAYVRLDAYRKPDGNVLFDDIEVRRLIPPIVEGFLLYPNYRGLLFDDRSQIIRVSVTVRPEEANTRLSELKVRVSLNRMIDGVDFPVVSVEKTPSRPSFVMELDARELPTGDYTLRLQAFKQQSAKNLALGSTELKVLSTESKEKGAEGKVLSVSSGSRAGQRLTPIFEYPAYRIVKAPGSMRSALRVYVDTDNALVMDGKRSFVLGIYDTTGYSNLESAYERRISKIAEAPLNMYLNYWLGRASDRPLATLARVLQRYGMYYLHTVNTWYEDYGGWSKTANCRGQKAAHKHKQKERLKH